MSQERDIELCGREGAAQVYLEGSGGCSEPEDGNTMPRKAKYSKDAT